MANDISIDPGSNKAGTNSRVNMNQEDHMDFAPETPSEHSDESESEDLQELGSDNATEILLEIRNDVKRINSKFDSLDR